MTNDIALVKQMLIDGSNVLVRHTVTLLIGAGVLFHMDPLMAAASLVFLPLIVFVGDRLGRRVRTLSKQVQERISDLTAFVTEAISGIRVLKAFTLEKTAQDMFELQNREVLSSVIGITRVQAGLASVVGFMGSATFIFVASLGGYRVLIGAITPGELVAFFLYTEMIAGPIGLLAGLYGHLQQTASAADRIFEIIDTPAEWPPEAAHNGRRLPKRVRGEVSFEGVTFGYGRTPAVRDVSFEVRPGESIALVGPSGGGKSTLLNLLLKFYTPDQGRILVDGVDIADVHPTELRAHIGIVPQETLLFALTIWENIACGRPDASMEEIVQAARAANAHDFIMDLDKGYDTPIGERGIKLSGGQRQRIAIARVMLKNPPILLLDEATSALDNEAERVVQEALDRLRADRTTLVVAHRLSTVRGCDRIFVLDKGRIVEAGSHRELIQAGGSYARLYGLQAEGA